MAVIPEYLLLLDDAESSMKTAINLQSIQFVRVTNDYFKKIADGELTKDEYVFTFMQSLLQNQYLATKLTEQVSQLKNENDIPTIKEFKHSLTDLNHEAKKRYYLSDRKKSEMQNKITDRLSNYGYQSKGPVSDFYYLFSVYFNDLIKVYYTSSLLAGFSETDPELLFTEQFKHFSKDYKNRLRRILADSNHIFMDNILSQLDFNLVDARYKSFQHPQKIAFESSFLWHSRAGKIRQASLPFVNPFNHKVIDGPSNYISSSCACPYCSNQMMKLSFESDKLYPIRTDQSLYWMDEVFTCWICQLFLTINKNNKDNNHFFELYLKTDPSQKKYYLKLNILNYWVN